MMKMSDVLTLLDEQQNPRGIEHWNNMENTAGLKSYGLGSTQHRKLAKKIGNGSNKMSRWLCKLGFEPINLVTGAVVYEGVDFELQSPIPFVWERVWD